VHTVLLSSTCSRRSVWMLGTGSVVNTVIKRAADCVISACNHDQLTMTKPDYIIMSYNWKLKLLSLTEQTVRCRHVCSDHLYHVSLYATSKSTVTNGRQRFKAHYNHATWTVHTPSLYQAVAPNSWSHCAHCRYLLAKTIAIYSDPPQHLIFNSWFSCLYKFIYLQIIRIHF